MRYGTPGRPRAAPLGGCDPPILQLARSGFSRFWQPSSMRTALPRNAATGGRSSGCVAFCRAQDRSGPGCAAPPVLTSNGPARGPQVRRTGTASIAVEPEMMRHASAVLASPSRAGGARSNAAGTRTVSAVSLGLRLRQRQLAALSAVCAGPRPGTGTFGADGASCGPPPPRLTAAASGGADPRSFVQRPDFQRRGNFLRVDNWTWPGRDISTEDGTHHKRTLT
jgi:hypothetical protein